MRRPPSSCSSRPVDRVGRGLLAIIMLIVATNVGNPWCAVPAFLCAACMAFGAITGWCPTDLFRREDTAPNQLGYAEARDSIKL